MGVAKSAPFRVVVRASIPLGVTRIFAGGGSTFYPGPNGIEQACAEMQNNDIIEINPGLYSYPDGNPRIVLNNIVGTIRGKDPNNKPILQMPNGVNGGLLSHEWIPYAPTVGATEINPGVLTPTAASNYTTLAAQPYDFVFQDIEFRGGKAHADPGNGTMASFYPAGRARVLVYRCKFTGNNNSIIQSSLGGNTSLRSAGIRAFRVQRVLR